MLTKLDKISITSPAMLLRDAKLNHIISGCDDLHLSGEGMIHLDDFLIASSSWELFPDGTWYNTQLDLGVMNVQRKGVWGGHSVHTFVLPF